jgi:type VI secretion system protein ImpE
MTALELYEAGQLSEAIPAALAEVKSRPTEFSSRFLLIVLLCFNGELERADRQLGILSTQNPDAAVAAALLRQLIRAELCRQEFLTAGRVPEFTAPPPENIQLHLKASICIREGQLQEAADFLAQAEQMRAPVAGVCDGQEFGDFRDLDDLFAPVLEALTTTGKYFWIPISDITGLEFSEPQSLADLLWRPVHLTIRSGLPGAVYVPTLYCGSGQAEKDTIRLGRETDWTQGEQAPIRGQGLRMFLVGDDASSIMDVRQLIFNHGPISDDAMVAGEEQKDGS